MEVSQLIAAATIASLYVIGDANAESPVPENGAGLRLL